MPNFSTKLNRVAKDTDKFLKKFLGNQSKKSDLSKSIYYGLFSGGKRFRSSIVVNTGKIFGINYKKLIAIGSAIECIHSYSLIHDDLPAMDNDDLRRGKPSLHKRFNEFTAILAGNSLLTLAFEILAENNFKILPQIKNELLKSITYCCGRYGLAGGQYLDLTLENKKSSKKKIINMQKKKTGALFGFCCEFSAILLKKNLKKRSELKKIGIDIGLLFQIADDLIDYEGDSFIAGKYTKKDFKKGKATLINLIGYKETLNYAEKLKIKIEKKIKKYGNKSNDLLESVEFILKRKF